MVAVDMSVSVRAPFERVLCMVGDAPGEAADQALAIVGPGGSITFVGRGRSSEAVEAATQAAKLAGVKAESDALDGQDVNRALFERAAGFDALVVAAHGHARLTA